MRSVTPGRSADGAEFPGGTPAPADGTYALLNVLGGRTEQMVRMRQGEKLPDAPRGFVWVVVPAKSP